MGRYYYSKKQEADYLKKIQIWWLKKHGYLNGWRTGTIRWTNSSSENHSSIGLEASVFTDEMYIRIYYTQTQEGNSPKEFDYKILLTTTPCYFGGRRYWFVCPGSINGKYCGRHVGVLYKCGDYFICRNCCNLTYSSRNETRSSHFYPLSYLLTGYSKAHLLESQIKRKQYAGRPTRKQMKLDNIFRRMLPYAKTYKQLEKRKLI